MNYEKELNGFLKYAGHYDRTNGMIELKVVHTLRVAEVMDRITAGLDLPDETRYLAALCAVFHDIGRFEQVTRYGTYNDRRSVNHAVLSCEVLRENGFLEHLPERQQEMILTAIENHNKLAIDDGLDEDTMLLAKLIRDADKVDIFRVFAEEEMVDTMGEMIEMVEQETVTDEVFEHYTGQTLLLRGPYGNGFDTDLYADGETVVVAGGTGVSPVRGVIEALSCMPNAKEKYVIAGFRSPDDMLFRDDLARWKDELNLILTVDGAPEGYDGNIGLVTKYIADLPLKSPEAAKAVVVGPPAMMRFTIIELQKKGFKDENITVSYERKMCCGLGKCGHCRVNDKYICLDGPVFNYTEGKLMMD